MPWSTRSTVSLREEFVTLAGQPGAIVRELCRRYDVSPTTAYKWLARFRDDGREGLGDRSRRPVHQPLRSSAATENHRSDSPGVSGLPAVVRAHSSSAAFEKPHPPRPRGAASPSNKNALRVRRRRTNTRNAPLARPSARRGKRRPGVACSTWNIPPGAETPGDGWCSTWNAGWPRGRGRGARRGQGFSAACQIGGADSGPGGGRGPTRTTGTRGLECRRRRAGRVPRRSKLGP
jgi:transposase-like protein